MLQVSAIISLTCSKRPNICTPLEKNHYVCPPFVGDKIFHDSDLWSSLQEIIHCTIKLDKGCNVSGCEKKNFHKHHTDGRQAEHTKGQDAQQLRALARGHSMQNHSKK